MQIGNFSKNTPDFACGTYTVANLLDQFEVREFSQLTGKGEARPTNDRAVKKLAKIILAGEFLPTPILAASDGSGGKLPIVLGATRFAALKHLLDQKQIEPTAEVPVVVYYGADPKEASVKAHYASGDFPTADLEAMESAVGIGVSGAESELYEVARAIAEALNNDDASLLKRQFRADKNSAMMEVADLTGGDLRTSLIGTAKLLKFFGHKGVGAATDAINRVLKLASAYTQIPLPPNHTIASIRHVIGVANQILFHGPDFTGEMILRAVRTFDPDVKPPKKKRTNKKEEDVTPKQYEDAYQGFEPEEDEVVSVESVGSFMESVKAAVSQGKVRGERANLVMVDDHQEVSDDERQALNFLKHAIFGEEAEDGPAKYLYGETYEDVEWNEPLPPDQAVSRLAKQMMDSPQDIVWGPADDFHCDGKPDVIGLHVIDMEKKKVEVDRATPTPSPAKPKSKKLKKLPPEAFVTPAIPFFTENHSPEITAETTADTIEVKPPHAIIKVDDTPKELILDPNQHPAVLAHKRAWRRPTEKRQLIADGFAPKHAQPDGVRYFEFGSFVWDIKLFEERCEWIGYHLLTQGKAPYRSVPIDTTWEDDEDAAQLAKYRDRIDDKNAWLNNLDANDSFELGNNVAWIVPEKKRQAILKSGGDWWR